MFGDLGKRILLLILFLVLYRLGTYIPIPGVNSEVIRHIIDQNSGTVLGVFDMFSGGALGRMTVFALGIMPYITSSIVIQLLSSVSNTLSQLKKEGERGRKIIGQYTRYMTVVLACVQGFSIALFLQQYENELGKAVSFPGPLFITSCVFSLVAGTMLLLWIGEQITQRAIGNGISLIIFAGIVAEFPSIIYQFLELGRTGSVDIALILSVVCGIFVILYLIVMFERAQRRIPIQYPRRQVGQNMMTEGQKTHLPLKINTAGVIPPILASALLTLPMMLGTFYTPEDAANADGILYQIMPYFSRGNIGYLIFFTVCIVFFSFFYTSIVFNPEETAENLKKNSGFVPGIRPGANTASYLDYVLTRLTVVGAAYLTLVCVLPELFIGKYSLPIFGGTSLLIIVNVGIDTFTQIQSYMFSQRYHKLIKQSKIVGGKIGKKGKYT